MAQQAEEEFPRLRREASDEQLRGMATAVRAAEAAVPTHPHQGGESPSKNLVVGPVSAAADRVRDANGKARG